MLIALTAESNELGGQEQAFDIWPRAECGSLCPRRGAAATARLKLRHTFKVGPAKTRGREIAATFTV